MQYINQINILTTQLNNEKEKYKQLEQKYNQLYTNHQNCINNINQLQSELNRYKNQLANVNLSLNNNNTNLNNEINKLRKQNEILFNQISIKDNEINNLKLKIENNYVSQSKVSKKDFMVINFVTGDGKIMNCGIGCLPDETFAEVEEKLYKIYDEYRNTNSNYFLYGGRTILRFKKIRENKIKNGAVIQLCQNE
jgi:seryl-tRNA synthetase